MDQTIGIQFEARGVQATIRQFEKVATALASLKRKIATQLGDISRLTNTVTMGVNAMNTAATGMARTSSRVEAAGKRVGRGMTPFIYANWAMAGARRPSRQGPLRPPIMPTFGSAAIQQQAALQQEIASARQAVAAVLPDERRGRGGRQQGSGRRRGGDGAQQLGWLDKALKSPTGLIGAPMFMMRWIAFHQLFRAAGASFTDLLLGAARQTVDVALMELGAISFTKAQEEQAYTAGMNLARRTGIFTTEKFIEAMSQVGSSLAIGDVGFETLRRGTEASMFGAVLTKMQPEKFAELLSQTLAATRNSAEFKGMGDAERMEKITAQYVKAVEITQEWGTGFSTAFRYLLPQFQQLGWSLARSLAFVGTFKTLGFHSGQIGRFGRYLSGQGLSGMASVFMKGMGLEERVRGTPRQKRAIKARQKIKKQVMQKLLLEGMETDMDRVLYVYSDMVGKFFKEGLTARDLGIATQWFPQILKMKEVMEQQWKDAAAKIGTADYLEMRQRVIDRTQREGLTLMRIQQGLKAMWESFVVGDFARPAGAFFEKASEWAHARQLGKQIKRGDIILDQEFRDKYIGYWSEIGGRMYADTLMSIVEIVAADGPWGRVQEGLKGFKLLLQEEAKMWNEIGWTGEYANMDFKVIKGVIDKFHSLAKFLTNLASLTGTGEWTGFEQLNQQWQRTIEPAKKLMDAFSESAPPPLEGVLPDAEGVPQIDPEAMGAGPVNIDLRVTIDGRDVAAVVEQRINDRATRRGFSSSQLPQKGFNWGQ